MKKGRIIGLAVGIGTFIAIRIGAAVIDHYQLMGERENSSSIIAIILLILILVYLIVMSIKEVPKGMSRVKLKNRKAKVMTSVTLILGSIVLCVIASENLGISYILLAILLLTVLIYSTLSIIHQDGVYEDYFWLKESKINLKDVKEYKIENTKITLYYNKKILFMYFWRRVSVSCKEKEANEIAIIMSKR
jgi:membrane-associated HD superfamily phosphohydrolase